tara:strand:- start:1066 stop:2160 length:1095 start_codon:yes stop_codon:yes gene_type:complete
VNVKRVDVQIGSRTIGDDQPTFLCFELGPTHDGLTNAFELINKAGAAGIDAVKLQIIDTDRLVSDRKQLFTYSILNPNSGQLQKKTEPLYDILKRRQLSERELEKIAEKISSMGMEFFATVSYEEDIELVKSLECASVKIASADVNHAPLLRSAARSGMSVQLDTGNSTIEEIGYAVDLLESENCYSIIIHHCPSGYPAYLQSISLRTISKIQKTFKYPVAFSDHSAGIDMNIAAVSLGASLIEKTVTRDRTTPSVEHCFSLEPDEFESFVVRIRELEVALGTNGDRVLSDEQIEARLKLRRSVFSARDAEAGTSIGELKVDYRRPGHGIPPNDWEDLCKSDRYLNKTVAAGEMLTLDMFDTVR